MSLSGVPVRTKGSPFFGVTSSKRVAERRSDYFKNIDNWFGFIDRGKNPSSMNFMHQGSHMSS